MNFLLTVLRIFRSVTFGLTLLTIVGVVVLFATMTPMEWSMEYIYRTWWFVLLLVVLSVNMALSTWRTLQVTIPGERKRVFLKNRQGFEHLPALATVADPAPDACPDLARETLRQWGYQVAEEEGRLCAVAGSPPQWGAVISHVGMIIIGIGAAIYYLFSIDGVLSVAEGEATNAFVLRQDLDQRESIPYQPLGAKVHLDDFEVLIHPQSGVPGRYISHVRLEQGGDVRHRQVEVNRSQRAGRYTLHQSSYGPYDEVERYLVAFDLEENGQVRRVSQELNLGEQKALTDQDRIELGRDGDRLQALILSDDGSYRVFSLAGADLARSSAGTYDPDDPAPVTVEMTRFFPSFKIGEGRAIFSSGDNWENPAIELHLYQGDRLLGRTWVFARPEFRDLVLNPELPCRFALDWLLSEEESAPFTADGATTAGLADIRPRLTVTPRESGEAVGTITLAVGQRVALPAAALPTAAAAPLDDDVLTTGSTEGRATAFTLFGHEKVQAHYTVLSVTRGPGVGLIYFGCFLLSVGPVLAFASRRRWVLVARDGTDGQILIGGRSRHALEAVSRDVDRLAATLGRSASAP